MKPETVDLSEVEQYRMQMTAISSAAFGYWTKDRADAVGKYNHRIACVKIEFEEGEGL